MMQDLINDYNNGIGTKELAKKYNIHRSTVQQRLLRNGVKLRKHTYVKNCRDDVFDTYTPESCYWAGFIAADGYIRSNRYTLSIKLAIKDLGHLVKFKEFIQTDTNINHHKDYYYVDITNKKIVTALANNFNIVTKKSYILKPPYNMPEEFISHFIRGVFDGDGCITTTTTITCNFTGASVIFRDWIREKFYDIGIRLKSRNRIPPIAREVQFSYSGKNAIKVMEWMYKDSYQAIRLDRKRERYEYLKEQFG